VSADPQDSIQPPIQVLRVGLFFSANAHLPLTGVSPDLGPLNPPLNILEMLDLEVNVSVSHAGLCVAHKFSKLYIANLPYPIRSVRMPGAVEHNALAALHSQIGPFADPIHLRN